jgi:hypothetical protein
MKTIILAASSIVVVAACGGGEPVHEGSVNFTGAKTSVESVSDVFAALDSSSGENAADAVLALTAAGQILVTPGAGHVPPMPASLIPREWAHKRTTSSFTGSAECDASGCTFNNYGDSYDGTTFVINGSVRRAGDTLTFDLTYDITSTGFDFHWRMDGNVTVNASLIDGEVHSDGDAHVTQDGRTYNVGWDFDIDYDHIGLVDGCPVSGSLTATVGYSVSGAQSGSYRARGSIAFGPSCGQFHSN